MLVLSTIFLFVLSVLGYQVTSPGDNQGWTTAGPNLLQWQRVDTDPLTFAVSLTNVNTNSNQLLISSVNGTQGSVECPAPSGGWPTGSGFRVNLAQDASHLDSLLAQSNQFNITAASSSQSPSSTTSTGLTTSSGSTISSGSITSPASAQSATSTPTASISSSETSTTPSGTSAAPLSVDAGFGWLTVVGVLTALVNAPF